MAKIYADRFTGTAGGGLSTPWATLGTREGITLSTASACACLTAGGVWAMELVSATGIATGVTDMAVSVWMRTPNTSSNSGLIIKCLDENNFLYLQQNSSTLELRNRIGGTWNLMATVVGGGSAAWRRYTVRLRGTTAEVYLDGLVHQTLEGPHLREIVTAFATATGRAGIITTGSPAGATGENGPRWSGFYQGDLQHGRVYFSTAGAATGTVGTIDSPDSSIGLALNHCDFASGSTAVGDGAFGANDYQFSQGNKHQWNSGMAFPEFSSAGVITDPGACSIVRGNATATFECRVNKSEHYWEMRGRASHFFLLDTLITDYCSANNGIGIHGHPSNNIGGTVDRSFGAGRCKFVLGIATGTNFKGIQANKAASEILLSHNYLTAGAKEAHSLARLVSNVDLTAVTIERTVAVGQPRELASIGAHQHGPWLFDHNSWLVSGYHFIDFEGAYDSDAGTTATVSNNLIVGSSATGAASVTAISLSNSAGVSGLLHSTNNAFWNVTQPHTSNITSIVATASAAPEFGTATGGYTWSEGGGWTLDTDYRPRSTTLYTWGDDGLTVGALQGVTAAATAEPATGGLFTSFDNYQALVFHYQPIHRKEGGFLKVTGPLEQLDESDATGWATRQADYGNDTLFIAGIQSSTAHTAKVFWDEQARTNTRPYRVRSRLIYPTSPDQDSEIDRLYILSEEISTAFTDQSRFRWRKADATASGASSYREIRAGILDRQPHPFFAEGFQLQVTGNNSLVYWGARISKDEPTR